MAGNRPEMGKKLNETIYTPYTAQKGKNFKVEKCTHWLTLETLKVYWSRSYNGALFTTFSNSSTSIHQLLSMSQEKSTLEIYFTH